VRLNDTGRPISEDQYNRLVKALADPKVVQDFWLGEERPADWPEAVPFPAERVVLPRDWVVRRRVELGLGARRRG
jgi:hypothetical protein